MVTIYFFTHVFLETDAHLIRKTNAIRICLSKPVNLHNTVLYRAYYDTTVKAWVWKFINRYLMFERSNLQKKAAKFQISNDPYGHLDPTHRFALIENF